MKISIAVEIFAIAAAVTAMGLVAALGTIQIAQAIPQSSHGTCLKDSNNGQGASGCVGNNGGSITNRHWTRPHCVNNATFLDGC